MAHSALLVVDLSKSESPIWKDAWDKFLTAANKQLGKKIDDHALGDNIWLIPLDSALHVFSILSALATIHGLKHQVLFLNDKPTWITPKIVEEKP